MNEYNKEKTTEETVKEATVEKQETNYEHYREEFENLNSEVEGLKFQCHIRTRVMNMVCDDGMTCKECMCKIFEWLSQPYEEPKPKIKLTQWEYDLLETNDQPRTKTFNSFATYRHMKEKCYFKDVDVEMTLEEILNNCEVVAS
jgi:hypothetical protein